MGYLFTSESVSEGHPDKVADQISDAVLDQFLAYDPNSKVACETLVTTGQVVVAGEVKSEAYVDLQDVVRRTIARIGYTKADYKLEAESCGIFSAIHEQSCDINRGVDRKDDTDPMAQGAGDQGMMFGYANNETDTFMPLPLALAHEIVKVLADIRREGKEMTYLRPDSKSQVTVEYDDNHVARRIDTIVVSTQHDEFITAEEAGSQDEADRLMLAQIRRDVEEILIPRLLREKVNTPEILQLFEQGGIKYFVNPTGKFVIGGPHGDTGLTGRKNIVDTYGRSHVALSDGESAQRIQRLFDLRPAAIERDLELRHPIYEETASYGHMGRRPRTVVKTFRSMGMPDKKVSVELFTWEKLNKVDMIRKEFGLA